MDKKELYEEKKKEMVELALKLSKIDKERGYLDLLYTKELGEFANLEFKLVLEGNKIKKKIELLKEGKTVEESYDLAEKEFEKHHAQYQALQLKLSEAKRFPITKINSEEEEELEKLFLEAVINYNPNVKGRVTKDDVESWKKIQFFYNNNRLLELKEFLENLNIPKDSFDENFYDEKMEYYQKMIESGEGVYQNLISSYPYNQKDLLSDDILITRKIAEFRQRNYDLNNTVKKLEKELSELSNKTI